MARASNPRGITATWVRDQLDGPWGDEDFVRSYPATAALASRRLSWPPCACCSSSSTSRPASSRGRPVPHRLQVRPGHGLDDPGFHHSVWTDFRDRPSQDDRADQLLFRDSGPDAAGRSGQGTGKTANRLHPGPCRSAGTHPPGTRPRSGTHRAGRSRRSRCRDAGRAGGCGVGRPPRPDCPPPSQSSHPVTRLKQAGTDARRLLERLPPHQCGPRAEVPRQIMVQNFLLDTCGTSRPRTEEDGQPKGVLRTVSPYDREARRAIRGNTRWSGYLVHVTEACDGESRVNLIKDIAATTQTPKPCPAPTTGSAPTRAQCRGGHTPHSSAGRWTGYSWTSRTGRRTRSTLAQP